MINSLLLVVRVAIYCKPASLHFLYNNSLFVSLNFSTPSNKISFKNEQDKYDVKLFTDILLQRLVECCRRSTDNRYMSAYVLTSELKKKLSVKNLDYKAQFEKYLINLRSIMKGE